MKASVVVPTMGRSIHLKNSLLSLQKQSFPQADFEIIVVNNGTGHDAQDVVNAVNKAGGKQIICVNEPELGLHNARHAGARKAQGEIVAYTDDDVVCDPQWLSELVKCFTGPEVGCAGGKIVAKWEAEPPPWINQYLSYLSILDWGDEVKELSEPLIFGCNYSIRRSLLFKVGGFNPEAFGDIWLGDGETGLLRKVLKSGYKIIYNPKAVIWHIIPPGRITLKYMKLRYVNEGATYSYTFHHHNKNVSGFKTLLYSGYYALRAVKQHILAAKSQSKKDSDYYRHELNASSFWSQCRYELRFVFSHKLRDMVFKEDWINRD